MKILLLLPFILYFAIVGCISVLIGILVESIIGGFTAGRNMMNAMLDKFVELINKKGGLNEDINK